MGGAPFLCAYLSMHAVVLHAIVLHVLFLRTLFLRALSTHVAYPDTPIAGAPPLSGRNTGEVYTVVNSP